MTNVVEELEVEEISILSKNTRPAVRGALVMLAKSDQPADFQTRVAEIRKRDNCSGVVALQKARLEFPTEFSSWQATGLVPARPKQTIVAKADAVAAFEQRVVEIASKGVSRTEALGRARALFPQEFDAYQAV